MSTLVLNGETKIFPIVGDPISQVRSPKYLSEIMAARELNSIVPPVHVSPADLAGFMKTAPSIQNLGGVVVTLPHKTASIEFCDEVTERAKFIGAVNVVRRLSDGRFVGDNLDGVAYLSGIATCGGSVEGAKVLQIGAGGAGSAVGYQFLVEGCEELHLFDLDKPRLEAFVERLNERFPGRASVAQSSSPVGKSIIANVTPVGMKETDPAPFPLDELTAEMFFADAITKPTISKTGLAAQALGCGTMQGEHMFDAQAEKLVDYLTQDEASFLKQFNSL